MLHLSIALNKETKMKKALVLFGSLLFCHNVFATTWGVENVLHGSDGGFGFSSMHQANDSTPMSGSILVNIDSASGSYDDVSGALNLVLGLSNSDSVTLIGTLFFDVAGILASDSSLNYSGLTNLAASTFGTSNSLGASGSFGFLGQDVCCSGSHDPNSFQPASGGLNYLTLWGADYGDGTFLGNYNGSIVGMDLRLELSEVPVPTPVPAAVWLFGTALIGFVGMSRRRKVA
jgi:hypothetical protein